MIEGKEFGKQPKRPVGVPSIDELFGRNHFKGQALVPIRDDEEFERIRSFTLSREFDTSRIPLLGREPQSEQELLELVKSSYRDFGIEKIIRVQRAFPDLLVKLDGKAEEIHLELELYSRSFNSHGHAAGVVNRCFVKDGKPVAVLCWIHDDRSGRVEQCVQGVFELQALLREGRTIRWSG
jgi:hypothetical protein